MKRFISLFLILFSLGAGWAFAQEAEGAGSVVQLFACTLDEGQTADNVWAAVESLARTASAQPVSDPAFGLFLWTAFREATPYDFVFGVISSDLVTMAEGSEAFAASAGARENGLRFAALGQCDSLVAASEQLTTGSIGMTGGDRERDAVVEVFQCRRREGKSMDDVRSAVRFWQEQIPEIGSAAADEYGAFFLTPIRGGTGSDFLWVGNSPNLRSWAQSFTDYVSSNGGRAAEARFDEVSTCVSSMWNGYWLVTPRQF